MERLKFIVTTKCGDKFNGKMEHKGYWRPQRELKIDIAGRNKTCELCEKKDRWIANGKYLNRFQEFVCPAIGLLISRNGAEDMP